LGDAFDLVAFHDALLERGNLPLAVLERRMADFIAQGSAAAPGS
jgi:uncharacterized protein (DUF885 family)